MRVGEFRLRRCSACGSLFVPDAPPQERLDELYRDERYFANPDFNSPETDGFHGYLDYIADRDFIEEKFDRVLERIEAWIRPGTLLDVGAGPGFLLSVARRRGWSGRGLEVNPWAAEYARDIVGVEVELSTLGPADLEPASLDVVTMMDLIEHVPDPDGLVAAAAAATRPGGLVAVLTPDAGSLVSRLLGRRWPEVRRVPEHLLLFSVSGLTSLLARHGYESLEWHSIGKTSSIATLIADVSPVAPSIGRPLQRYAARSRLANRSFLFDPRTKFCLYARRLSRPL